MSNRNEPYKQQNIILERVEAKRDEFKKNAMLF